MVYQSGILHSKFWILSLSALLFLGAIGWSLLQSAWAANTATSTIKVYIAGVINTFTFEQGTTQGWTMKEGLGLGAPYVLTTAQAHGGTRCLVYPLYFGTNATHTKIDSNSRGAHIILGGYSWDWSAKTTVTFHFKVVNGVWGTKGLWVEPYCWRYNGTKWVSNNIPAAATRNILPANGWVTITWNISALTPRKQIGELGFRVDDANGASGSAQLLLDDISIN